MASATVLPHPDTTNVMLSAITSSALPTLRSLLEAQDVALLSACAKSGTPELASYLLSRLPPPSSASSPSFFPSSPERPGSLQFNVPTTTPEATYLTTHLPYPLPSPTNHSLLYLLQSSAQHGNVPLFAFLSRCHPNFLTTENRNIDRILLAGIWSPHGVAIWRVILSHDRRFMDYEFSGHQGTVLERIGRYAAELGEEEKCRAAKEGEGKVERGQRRQEAIKLLEFLLKEGADTELGGGEGNLVAQALSSWKVDEEVLGLVEQYGREKRVDRTTAYRSN